MKDTTQRLRMVLEPKVFKNPMNEYASNQGDENSKYFLFGTVPVLLRVYFRFDSTIAGRLVATGNSTFLLFQILFK